ncbi:MAG: transketolase C-terminal domain-containing protein, partial [Cyclobacteriaceae bacterium]
TYGMGVYWATAAAEAWCNQVTVFDLRSLNPLDEETIMTLARQHGRVLVVTEEPLMNSFAESLAGRISEHCFAFLDAPVMTIGAANLPAVPLNVDLEKMMLPNVEKVKARLRELLAY